MKATDIATQNPRFNEMLAERERFLSENPEIKTAGELGPLILDKELQQIYWQWQIGIYFDKSN